jgi:hypothetical protein
MLALLAVGCAPYARVTVRPTEPGREGRLAPRLITRAYAFEDENAVDIYLSDLAPEQLAVPWDNAGQPVGQIIHIHMFIRPQPGRTPIEPDALNATIRHTILAPDGAIGVYAGGGFLLPATRAGSGEFVGTIASGTLRLDAATPNFMDALGPSSFKASFSVRQDDELASRLAARSAESARHAEQARTPRDQ